MSDEDDDQEGTGQQGQEGPADTDEPANLDLPDDLQLDEEGNEGSEGWLREEAIGSRLGLRWYTDTFSCVNEVSSSEHE